MYLWQNGSLIYNQLNRTMVAAEDIRMNYAVFDPVLKSVRGQEIVDTPAHVLLPGIKHVGPPGVGSFQYRIFIAEAINKAAI